MKDIRIATTQVPVGAIIAFALIKDNIPNGWLLCDGTPIPAKYTQLIQLLSDASTPNLSGQVLIGTGKSPVSENSYALGQTGGEETHKLITEELAKHTHPYTYTNPLRPENDGFYGGSHWRPTDITRTTEYAPQSFTLIVSAFELFAL